MEAKNQGYLINFIYLIILFTIKKNMLKGLRAVRNIIDLINSGKVEAIELLQALSELGSDLNEEQEAQCTLRVTNPTG
jgi:Ca2+-binding EF-hand superfamily protein